MCVYNLKPQVATSIGIYSQPILGDKGRIDLFVRAKLFLIGNRVFRVVMLIVKNNYV